MDRFAAAGLKIERADKHIADLEKIVLSLPDSYTSAVETYESISLQQIVYTPPDIAKIADEMAVIIGDAIHNLRVAVEYAYLGAVERHASYAFDEHTKFPTGQTRKEVENALHGREIDSRSPEFFNRIVSDIKPYIAQGNFLIRLLHDLDVRDKHWLLIPVARVGQARDIVLQNNEGVIGTWNSYPVHGDGPYCVPIPPNHKVKNNGKLTVDVVFDEIDVPFMHGISVMSDLRDFRKIAVDVIQALNGPL